jgi:hypothetical protein
MPRIPDDGGGEPMSQYPYEKMSTAELLHALQTSPGQMQSVQKAWESFANTLQNEVLGDPACSLTAALKFLDGWSGEAATAFKNRAAAIGKFGGQLASAAIAAGEDFADPGQTFHVASSSIYWSINDMNEWLGIVKQAQDNWSMELSEVVWRLLRDNPNTISFDDLTGAVEATPVQGDYYNRGYTFTYFYGYGLPGLAQFSGTLDMNTGARITAYSGPYGNPTRLLDPGTFLGNTVKDNFPEPYQNQLQLLLKQAGGSLYAPQVGKFPAAPKPSWTVGSTTPTPTPNTNGGYNGGGGLTGGLGGGGGLTGGGPYLNGSPIPGGGGGTGGGGTGGGGLPGGGGGGTGTGGLPGGGLGGGAGTGGGGLPGGGSGGTGGAGLPGGYGGGSGGLPGGPGSGGGSTKLAGFDPGGLGGGGLGGAGGLGPVGGGAGIGAGGLGSSSLGSTGLGSGLSSGLGSSGLGSASSGTAGLTGASTTAGEMPMMPPMMPPSAGAGQNDNTRQRKSWLPGDEDLWGDDDAAVPPVISSDG